MNHGSEVLETTRHGTRLAFKRGFTPSDQTGLVRLDFDKHIYPARAGCQQGFDVRDFHGAVRKCKD